MFVYPPITTDSNFLPIAVVIRKEGVLLPHLGVTVSLTVRHRTAPSTYPPTLPIVVVADAAALPVEGVDGRWEYRFTPDQVSGIANSEEWLVEWKLSVGEYVHRFEPALLPVRKKL